MVGNQTMARSAEVTDVEKQVPAREDVSEIRSLPETISTSYRARITRTFVSRTTGNAQFPSHNVLVA